MPGQDFHPLEQQTFSRRAWTSTPDLPLRLCGRSAPRASCLSDSRFSKITASTLSDNCRIWFPPTTGGLSRFSSDRAPTEGWSGTVPFREATVVDSPVLCGHVAIRLIPNHLLKRRSSCDPSKMNVCILPRPHDTRSAGHFQDEIIAPSRNRRQVQPLRRPTSSTQADFPRTASRDSSHAPAGRAVRRVPGRGHWSAASPARDLNSTFSTTQGENTSPSFA